MTSAREDSEYRFHAELRSMTSALSIPDHSWPLWPLMPLYPRGNRRTLCQVIVPDWIWTFEQVQGILYVVVPIRMTVIRLEAGGLLIYAPIAPTGECRALLQTLIDQYGDVKYIILPTTSGLEHKVFVGPFARYYRQAHVYLAPHQWSFPLQLPLSWLGFPLGRTHLLSDPVADRAPDVPWGDEFDYAILGPIDLGLGNFEEVALFHRATGSLLLTDTIVSIPTDPLPVLEIDPYPLLFHARDHARDQVLDTPENRIKGWQRTALFAFYFQPSVVKVPTLAELWRSLKGGHARSRKNYFGLYPFDWQTNWPQSFEALSTNPLLVAPVLQHLILNRDPQATQDWLDRVSAWPFTQIIPCHLAAPISATPLQLRQAFDFLHRPPAQLDADAQFLTMLSDTLDRLNITPPARYPVADRCESAN